MSEMDNSSGSMHRVALDLAKIIEQAEQDTEHYKRRTRQYWLELYASCLSATKGGKPAGNVDSLRL